MQHQKHILSLLTLAAMVVPAAAEPSAEAAYEQLRGALAREIDILASVQDAAGAEAALPQLEAVIRELASMDRSYEAEQALWQYIDNTEGAKHPLIELLQRLSIQFSRLTNASFYENEKLRLALAPQIVAPEKEGDEKAKAVMGPDGKMMVAPPVGAPPMGNPPVSQ